MVKKLTFIVLACLLASCSKPLEATSNILGTDLPGALPAERGAEITKQTTQEMARTFQQECGPVEVFEVADATKTRKAVDDAIVAKNYRKNLITTVDNGSVYALSGPKKLLVVDSGSSLGICELLGT